jgi:hypothetical protein
MVVACCRRCAVFRVPLRLVIVPLPADPATCYCCRPHPFIPPPLLLHCRVSPLPPFGCSVDNAARSSDPIPQPSSPTNEREGTSPVSRGAPDRALSSLTTLPLKRRRILAGRDVVVIRRDSTVEVCRGGRERVAPVVAEPLTKGAQPQVGPPQRHWLPGSLPEQHDEHPRKDPDQ